jgi:hypothetical protein
MPAALLDETLAAQGKKARAALYATDPASGRERTNAAATIANPTAQIAGALPRRPADIAPAIMSAAFGL